jgi:hypothetical protein
MDDNLSGSAFMLLIKVVAAGVVVLTAVPPVSAQEIRD